GIRDKLVTGVQTCALPIWVHVLVKIGAIEFSQRVSVFWKMRRHPIHDHADAGLMTFIDEITEFIRRTEPTGGRVIISDLITPGTFEGVLRNWQQFDMRVAHLQHVWQQRLSKLQIAKLTISFLSLALPRAQMNFVN